MNLAKASPRYRYDVESNKFIMVQEKSPTRGTKKTTIKLTPAQLEKKRYIRQCNDAAAMKILAPMLYNQNRPQIMTDVNQVIQSIKRHNNTTGKQSR